MTTCNECVNRDIPKRFNEKHPCLDCHGERLVLNGSKFKANTLVAINVGFDECRCWDGKRCLLYEERARDPYDDNGCCAVVVPKEPSVSGRPLGRIE
jgi:hypothetical protein